VNITFECGFKKRDKSAIIADSDDLAPTLPTSGNNRIVGTKATGTELMTPGATPFFFFFMRRTPIQPNYGSNSHRMFGDAFFFRVLPFENFFGFSTVFDTFCENPECGTPLGLHSKINAISCTLSVCQGCSGSISW
jgi:hypothetical protein